YYQVYDVRDDVTDMPALSCGHTVDPVQHNEELLKNLKNDYPQLAARTTEDQVELRTYVLAMTNTGEYAENYYGSSKDLVLASFVTAINRLNQTYQRDIAVKFLLHTEEDKLI